jgi:hypothetical protein
LDGCPTFYLVALSSAEGQSAVDLDPAHGEAVGYRLLPMFPVHTDPASSKAVGYRSAAVGRPDLSHPAIKHYRHSGSVPALGPVMNK